MEVNKSFMDKVSSSREANQLKNSKINNTQFANIAKASFEERIKLESGIMRQAVYGKTPMNILKTTSERHYATNVGTQNSNGANNATGARMTAQSFVLTMMAIRNLSGQNCMMTKEEIAENGLKLSPYAKPYYDKNGNEYYEVSLTVKDKDFSRKLRYYKNSKVSQDVINKLTAPKTTEKGKDVIDPAVKNALSICEKLAYYTGVSVDISMQSNAFMPSTLGRVSKKVKDAVSKATLNKWKSKKFVPASGKLYIDPTNRNGTEILTTYISRCAMMSFDTNFDTFMDVVKKDRTFLDYDGAKKADIANDYEKNYEKIKYKLNGICMDLIASEMAKTIPDVLADERLAMCDAYLVSAMQKMNTLGKYMDDPFVMKFISTTVTNSVSRYNSNFVLSTKDIVEANAKVCGYKNLFEVGNREKAIFGEYEVPAVNDFQFSAYKDMEKEATINPQKQPESKKPEVSADAEKTSNGGKKSGQTRIDDSWVKEAEEDGAHIFPVNQPEKDQKDSDKSFEDAQNGNFDKGELGEVVVPDPNSEQNTTFRNEDERVKQAQNATEEVRQGSGAQVYKQLEDGEPINKGRASNFYPNFGDKDLNNLEKQYGIPTYLRNTFVGTSRFENDDHLQRFNTVSTHDARQKLVEEMGFGDDAEWVDIQNEYYNIAKCKTKKEQEALYTKISQKEIDFARTRIYGEKPAHGFDYSIVPKDATPTSGKENASGIEIDERENGQNNAQNVEPIAKQKKEYDILENVPEESLRYFNEMMDAETTIPKAKVKAQERDILDGVPEESLHRFKEFMDAETATTQTKAQERDMFDGVSQEALAHFFNEINAPIIKSDEPVRPARVDPVFSAKSKAFSDRADEQINKSLYNYVVKAVSKGLSEKSLKNKGDVNKSSNLSEFEQRRVQAVSAGQDAVTVLFNTTHEKAMSKQAGNVLEKAKNSSVIAEFIEATAVQRLEKLVSDEIETAMKLFAENKDKFPEWGECKTSASFMNYYHKVVKGEKGAFGTYIKTQSKLICREMDASISVDAKLNENKIPHRAIDMSTFIRKDEESNKLGLNAYKIVKVVPQENKDPKIIETIVYSENDDLVETAEYDEIYRESLTEEALAQNYGYIGKAIPGMSHPVCLPRTQTQLRREVSLGINK